MRVEATVSPAVQQAIQQASRATGTSFQYLLATAQVESNFNPHAAGRTSSARGLYQFIDQTWLATLKEHGPALGYGAYSAAIGRMTDGQYVVTDPRKQSAVLALRHDPTANAMMAGAFTRTNAAQMTEALGRAPTEGELYIAHFLGSAGAVRLVSLANHAPRSRADAVFPTAARANPAIFYRRGQARSAGELYHMLVGRYDQARAPRQAAEPKLARAPRPVPEAVATPPQQQRTASKPVVLKEEPTFAPDTAGLTEAYAVASRLSEAKARVGDVNSVFHGLFRTVTARREAVAPVVSALWSDVQPAPPQATEPPAQRTVHTAQASAAEPPPARSVPTPLDLFHEHAPDARALFRGRV